MHVKLSAEFECLSLPTFDYALTMVTVSDPIYLSFVKNLASSVSFRVRLRLGEAWQPSFCWIMIDFRLVLFYFFAYEHGIGQVP